jgi:hypothetical protein
LQAEKTQDRGRGNAGSDHRQHDAREYDTGKRNRDQDRQLTSAAFRVRSDFSKALFPA